MTQTFRKDVQEGHLVFWNTNPKFKNALTESYNLALIDALAEASADPAIGSVILAAEGDFFCSGGDLNFLKENNSLSEQERFDNINALHDVIKAIRTCTKPVICAVEGGAAGAGLSLVMACDMIVAAEQSKFILAYVNAGLVPDGGVTHSLRAALPRALVSKLAMLGEPISAQRLFELGAISEVTLKGQALEKAQKLAARIYAGPENAIGSIKALLEAAETNSLDAQLDLECNTMAQALAGEEASIGVSAFLNKEAPKFRSS